MSVPAFGRSCASDADPFGVARVLLSSVETPVVGSFVTLGMLFAALGNACTIVSSGSEPVVVVAVAGSGRYPVTVGTAPGGSNQPNLLPQMLQCF